VQTTPWTGGCTIVTIVLGVLALYLDSLAAVAGAMGLTALLCGQAGLFLYRTARYADGLQVERSVGKGPVCVGMPVEVSVRATAPAVPGLLVRLTDLPPRSAVYDPEEAVLPREGGRYRVRFIIPGEVGFRGLLLETGDRFFSTKIVCASSGCAGEKITVYPAASRISEPTPGSDAGTRELDRMGIPRGEGVSGFRPFRRGDDASMVDWKLTAKYGLPFVREPTSEVGNAPLVVVDLPVPGTPGAAAVLAAAGEAIEREVRDQGQCTLLLITGGAVVDFRYHERDLGALLGLLSLRIPDPVHPLYRVLDPLVLLERLQSIERGLLIPSQRLATVLRMTLRRSTRTAFEAEIDHAMKKAENRVVVVYTASSDEVSHLNLIAAAARRRRRHLVIRLPRAVRAPVSLLSPYPRVEAI